MKKIPVLLVALFIFLIGSLIFLIGCWRSEQPKAVVQNVAKESKDSFIWLSRASNIGATVQVRWYYSMPGGITSSEDGIGLVVDSHVVIAEGWAGISDTSGRFVLEKVVILPLSKTEPGDEVPVHLVAARLTPDLRTPQHHLTILAAGKELSVKPVVFARFSYMENVKKAYRFLYTRKQGSFFDFGKAVPVSVEFPLDTRTCQVQVYDWVKMSDDYYDRYGNLTAFDKDHRLLCFDGVSAQQVRKFLEKNHLSVLSK